MVMSIVAISGNNGFPQHNWMFWLLPVTVFISSFLWWNWRKMSISFPFFFFIKDFLRIFSVDFFCTQHLLRIFNSTIKQFAESKLWIHHCMDKQYGHRKKLSLKKVEKLCGVTYDIRKETLNLAYTFIMER